MHVFRCRYDLIECKIPVFRFDVWPRHLKSYLDVFVTVRDREKDFPIRDD